MEIEKSDQKNYNKNLCNLINALEDICKTYKCNYAISKKDTGMLVFLFKGESLFDYDRIDNVDITLSTTYNNVNNTAKCLFYFDDIDKFEPFDYQFMQCLGCIGLMCESLVRFNYNIKNGR